MNLIGTLIGSFIGAIFSGGIAVYIFHRGIKEQSLKENFQRKERIERNIKTFAQQLENIVNYLRKQMDEFDSYIKLLEKFPYYNSSPIEIPSNEIERILKTDTKDLLDFFESKHLSDEDYLKTINTLDYLYNVSRQWPKDTWENNVKHIHDLTNQILIFKREIMVLLADNLKDKEPDFVIFVTRIIEQYYKEPSKIGDLSYENDKFLHPLHLELLKYYDKGDFYNSLIKNTKYSIDILYTIQEDNKIFRDSFIILKRNYFDKVIILEEIIKKLK